MKLEAIWYGRHWLAWPLVPLAGLYRLVVAARRSAFRRGWLASVRLPVPVILVGNLTVGGTGKTPLVLWLSDLLLSGMAHSATAIERMFLAAGCLSLAAFASAYWATTGYVYPVPRRRPPLWGLIRRYHPGRIMVMGVAMGFGLGLPSTFVRTYAAELQIPRIGWFFTVYAVTAIVTRVVTRRLPEQYGLRPVVLAGLGLVMVSQFLFLIVGNELALMIPSVTYGIGHAILFPAGFAEGCCTFPPRYRGLGTSLMLATYDVGLLIGAPTAGLLVHCGQTLGWPGYPTMFVGVAIVLALATGVYATAPREIKPRRRKRLSSPTAAPVLTVPQAEPVPPSVAAVTPATDFATSYPAAAAGTPGTAGQTWLVMLYQDADDNVLEKDIYLDLNEAEKAGDSFQAPLPSLEPLQVDYLNRNLRVKQKGGKTWNFTADSADALLVFQKAVENARKRM